MNNKKKKTIIRCAIIIGVSVLVGVIAAVSFGNRSVGAKQFSVENTDRMDFNPFRKNENRLDNSLLEYGKVLTKYDQRGYHDYTGSPIEVDLSQLMNTADGDGALILLKDYEGYEGNGIRYLDKASQEWKTVNCSEYPDAFYASSENTVIEFKVTVPESALYSLNLDYLMLEAKDTVMYVAFYIDAKLPFANASNMALKRMYGFYNTNLEENLDISGNQIRPKQYELFEWQKNVTMSNPEGMYRNPYKFYMLEGEHTIRMVFSEQPGAIGAIRFTAPLHSPSYEEYVNANGGIQEYTGNPVRLEMEVPDFASTVAIRMEYDNDYASSPASYRVIRYNVFGGERWGDGGDSAQWSFTVPEDGWYQLGFRYQSINTYVAAYKEIKIDGVIPFAEMEEYCFPYANGWIGDCVKNDKNEPYLFYLKAGETHTIQITNKVGPLRHTYIKLDEAINSINTMVNQIAKITSSSRNSSGGYVVDRNRDWDLEKYIPSLQDDMDLYVKIFQESYQQILDANGGTLPSYGSAVQVAVELFEKMADDLEKVPISMNDITNALTGLSNTMVSIRSQAVSFDYMEFSAKGYSYPKARSGSLQNLYVGFIRFRDTFTKDYSSVGTRQELQKDMKTIEIYVSRGREYVDIMRNMVAEQFTPEYGIKVNLNMVAGSSEGLIMPRYVAGTAPDGAIAIGAGTPFEYAVRGALLPLDMFTRERLDNAQSGGLLDARALSFEELKTSSYYDEVFNPFLFQGQYYGFPETQGWSALFYRTDIFDELDIDPPDTWNDVYAIMPALTKDGYSFYFPYGVANYTPFLFQLGGNFYDEDGLSSALNSNAAYDAFVEYANLYLQYNFVYAADFYMRFKSGEMPVGIGDMGFYSKLKYSAPELNGKWEILPVPGHAIVNANGETVVDRSTGGVGTCAIIISSTDCPDETWAFMQWWLSDEVQSEYGREVESTFGVASRWNPANKNALNALPYTQDELDIIYSQWDWLREAPNTLGGYYTSRYLITALNQTVLQGMNPRVALEDAIKEINKELVRKQEEFDIASKGGSVLRASKDE